MHAGNYGPGLDWNPYRRSQWENGHGLCLTFNDNGRVMQKKYVPLYCTLSDHVGRGRRGPCGR
jgi:hypothetical protein